MEEELERGDGIHYEALLFGPKLFPQLVSPEQRKGNGITITQVEYLPTWVTGS